MEQQPLAGASLSEQKLKLERLLSLLLLDGMSSREGDLAVGVRREASKGLEDGCRLPALRAGHP
jgi:hypothetical protein